ncbi:MAG TPA: arginine deiminase family protein [Thermoanaerobaculia bacterium]|nr:arginine deiminase family protein [Thermoanaerobaculia bacterium]
MKLSVTSEIGRLRSVLVHLPGREIDVMMPSMMEQLLFDDILYGQLAREEHRKFQQVVRYVADEVYDLQDLLEEALEDEETRTAILADLARREPLSQRTIAMLREQPPRGIAEMLVAGIEAPETGNGEAHAFELQPVPNLFFMRDPQVVFGDGVIVSAMATEARRRESLLSRYVFGFHPSFRGQDLFWLDHYDTPWPKTAAGVRRLPTIEGGDVLVARRDLLLVGVTERTNRAGVERLAESLREGASEVKSILVVEIPQRRSYMHLDTVFTIISADECLVHAPVILEGGAEEAEVYELDLQRKQLSFNPVHSLLSALREKGMELEPIPCGGRNPIDQQREQWTDGANAFALAPGIILLYERNVRTAEELGRHGYHIVYEDDLLLGRAELDTRSGRKYAVQIQGHELSRARGGPRCMTMPLDREGPAD